MLLEGAGSSAFGSSKRKDSPALAAAVAEETTVTVAPWQPQQLQSNCSSVEMMACTTSQPWWQGGVIYQVLL